MLRTKPILLSSAIALLCSQFAYATTNNMTSQPHVVFDEETIRLMVPSYVEIIDNHKLKQSAAQNIEDIAMYEPGVEVRSDNMQLGHQNFAIRGIDGNRILMTIDGIPLPDEQQDLSRGGAQTPVTTRDTFETDTIRSVRLVKGGNGTAQGDGAIGGSVNLQTYSPHDFVNDDKPTFAGLKYNYRSTYDSHGVTATAAAKQGIASGLIMATRRSLHEAENYPADESPQNGVRRTESNDQDIIQNNILAKLHLDGEQHSLENTLEYFTRDVDTIRSDNVGVGRLASGSVQNRSIATASDEYSRLRYGMLYRYAPKQHWFDALSIHLYGQDLDVNNLAHTNDTITDTVGTVTNNLSNTDNSYTQKSKGIRTELRKQFSFKNSLNNALLGAEYRQTKTSRLLGQTIETIGGAVSSSQGAYFPPSDRRIFSIYAQNNIAFQNKATLGLGLRYELENSEFEFDHAAYVAAMQNQVVSFDSFKNRTLLPSIGLSYPITNDLTASATYRRGYRSPDVNFVGSGFSNQRGGYRIVPNPDLKPESSDNFEIGLGYRNDNLSVDLSAFYHKYKDFINLVQSNHNIPVGYRMQFHYNNIDKAQTYGAEAKFSYQISQQLKATGAVAWIDTKNLSTDQPLSTSYPVNGVLGLDYTQDKWDIGAKLRMATKNRQVPQASGSNTYFQAPGYAVLDLTGQYKVNDHISINAGIYNVTDKKYWLSGDTKGVLDNAQTDRYTQPGRNYALGVEFKF